MDTPEEIENTKEGSKKLGELLVSYRNKVGMDIDQAADAMCLTRGTLEALESEDFHLLPEAPYIRGYLRGYAKLANVSSAEAIALYESINGGNSSINPTYHFTPSAKTDNLSPNGLSSTVLRLGGLLLLLIVLAVVSTIPGVKDWAGEIWSEFSSETPTEQAASDEAVVVAEDSNNETDDKNRTQLALPKNTETLTLASSASDEPVDDDKEQTDESSSDDAPSADSLAGDIKREGEAEARQTSDSEDTNETKEEVASGDSESNDTSEQTDSENATDESNAETEASNDASDETPENESAESNEDSTDKNADGNEVAQAEDDETEQTGTENEATEVDLSNVNVEAGEVAIKLVFEDEVWMRIKKKDGKQIFEGLRQKGEVHEMKTVKPLDFKVGNAPGVKIYVNGELYDQSAHQRGVVSRFDLE